MSKDKQEGGDDYETGSVRFDCYILVRLHYEFFLFVMV